MIGMPTRFDHVEADQRLLKCAAARRVIAHLGGSRVSSVVWGDDLCARWLGVVELLVGAPLSDA